MTEPPATKRLEFTYAEAAELAFRLHGQRRYAESEGLYRQLLKLNPTDPNVAHYLGVLLFQNGRHAEAVELMQRSLEADDTVAAWHNNYGNVLLEADRFAEAAVSYQRCIELDPNNVEVLCNLGVLFRCLKRFDEAEAILTTAIAASPGFINAHVNMATLYWETGRFEEALAKTAALLQMHPRDVNIRKMLGQTYGRMGRLTEAAEVYREWLTFEPDSVEAQHYLAACTGIGVPERARDAYVERMFDHFAYSFDSRLTALQYRAPELVGAAVARLLPQASKDLRVLDAGCGTGLCGLHLAGVARELVGVDLSANMLERARARGVYTEVVKGELVAHLEAVLDPFDLVVSADTLCYFGQLEGMADATHHALRSGGLLIFTVEALTDGEDFRLHPHGRYSHRDAYVRATFEQAGFVVRELTDVALRMEAGRTVAGLLVVAEAARVPGAAA